MKFTISQKVLEQTVSYLATKPYNEVAKLIADIQRDIKPVEEQQEEAKSE